MPGVFINGRFVDRGDATVSAFDAGVQHGVGLFETMFAGAGGVLHLHEHVDRLVGSARALGLSTTLRAAALEEAVRRTAERAGPHGRWRLRLTITGGDLNLLERGAGNTGHDPTVLISATPATHYPAEMFERGVGVVVADLRVNPLDPLAGHKTLSYWGRLRELQNAAGKRAGEALVFQVTNHLAGGCVSNAMLVKAGTLVTPIARGEEDEVARGDEEATERRSGAVLPSPVLPGIVRRWAMDWARGAGIDVQRRLVRIEDVLAADELMLTNSSWGVLPVVKVEAEAIGDGVVGPITRKLCAAWSRLAAR